MHQSLIDDDDTPSTLTVKDLGIGVDVANDTESFRKAFANADTVLIPTGSYRVGTSAMFSPEVQEAVAAWAAHITLANLTPAMREGVCNGCGPRSTSWRILPQWHSRETCDTHDLAYWLGGTEEDRARADRELLNGMIRDAADRPWWQQPWYRLQAWIYYRGVRSVGDAYFRYGVRRTMEDLLREFPG